ncbi:hypothetical protein Pint_29960 [Pistacia integerrima]|uniref:Uncharacterized protein n=1 Tax=Pistacia integerrima TaxID=434235 RepID=A0ACC0X1S7_9ROSI|nr:hypothetical protein Pint_29960 [Pistacia integerrima]
MMAAAMTPNYHIAGIGSSAFYGVWNLFVGFEIPLKWSWYYWACPVSWTLYGMVASQYGDVKDRLDIVIGFTLLFASVFAISIKLFNFQRR